MIGTQNADRIRFPGIRLVVFDLDGTLIDAFADIAAAANCIRRQNGLPELTIDEVKKHVGRGARVLVQGILATQDDQLIDRNHAVLVDYYKNATETHATFYDGVLHAVDEIRARGMKTAVVTNKPDEVTQKILRTLNVYEKFDIILGESPRFRRKPFPDALIHVMAEAGVTAAQTLMVGDSIVDVEFARAVGVPVVVVTYGQMSESELSEHRPDAVINTMAELNPLLS